MQIINKKAKFNYILEDETMEAGVSLKGSEAKSLREGRGDLSQSYIKIINAEVYLVNANIPAPGIVGYVPTRSRKLLLHRSEITKLNTKIKQSGLHPVPLKLYNKGHLVKLNLALGKPKKQYQKKEAIKKHDTELDIAREIRGSKE